MSSAISQPKDLQLEFMPPTAAANWKAGKGGEQEPDATIEPSASAGQRTFTGRTQRDVPWEVRQGDALETLSTLPENHFACAVTSPPYYWQRDYAVAGQLGMEPTIQGYVDTIATVLDQVRRVLRQDGLLFLNLGDTYYSAKGEPKGADRKNGARRFGLRAVDASGLGVPRKTAIGIPWRVALEMVSRGWILRSPIIWRRTGSLPEPTAKDRPWRTYEMLFMFSKSPRYYFARESLGGEEDIWTISERPTGSKGIHSAAFPEKLVQKCLDVGCAKGGHVLDPFAGSGTVLRVSVQSGRPVTGIDLSRRFCEHMANSLHAL
ncbi:DNA-methyltransferase [Corallococcus llansteffanensis]|uniref:DNA-methyltransferase n=1 Tax=Corallococcus llansteffanensis TaxID=2316731 RepID=UPI0013159D87|nr:site-specific DNA-methyltransferase [Corallococcus llansteffanensis]